MLTEQLIIVRKLAIRARLFTKHNRTLHKSVWSTEVEDSQHCSEVHQVKRGPS